MAGQRSQILFFSKTHGGHKVLKSLKFVFYFLLNSQGHIIIIIIIIFAYLFIYLLFSYIDKHSLLTDILGQVLSIFHLWESNPHNRDSL